MVSITICYLGHLSDLFRCNHETNWAFFQNFDLLDAFSTEKFYLTVAGFYPVETDYNRYLYALTASVHLSISWLQFLSLVIYSCFNLNDLTKLSEILLFCMTQLAFLNKLTNLISRKESLRELENLLRKPIFTYVDIQGQRILTSHVDSGKLLAKIYRALCFLVVLFYALFPFLDERSGREHKFPLPCWFPFDEDNYYYPVFFVEIWSIAVSAAVNSSMDVLTVMTMTTATAQFKILNVKLVDISVPSALGGECAEDGSVRSRLRECVVHYDELLQ